MNSVLKYQSDGRPAIEKFCDINQKALSFLIMSWGMVQSGNLRPVVASMLIDDWARIVTRDYLGVRPEVWEEAEFLADLAAVRAEL